jgi:Hint module
MKFHWAATSFHFEVYIIVLFEYNDVGHRIRGSTRQAIAWSRFFDDIYMFGHKDATTMASFVRLETEKGMVLRLTRDHHVHIQQHHKSGATWMAIPASESKVGDLVRVFQGCDSEESIIQRIVSKSAVMDRGLYNPYTLGGSIIVDGVLASCHSSSALDDLFHLLDIPIADGYQAVFAPIRALYRVAGPSRMAAFEFVIDAIASAINEGTFWPLLLNSALITLATIESLLLFGEQKSPS